LSGFRVRGTENPRTKQDGVNLRTIHASEMRVLEQATSAADTTVSDVIRNHANILNREIQVKSLNLSPDGSTGKSLNTSGNRIVGLSDAETKSEAVNLRTLKENSEKN